jgi:hypothetical protein
VWLGVVLGAICLATLSAATISGSRRLHPRLMRLGYMT